MNESTMRELIHTSTSHPKTMETPIKNTTKHKCKTTYVNIERLKNMILGASLIVVGMLSAKLTGDGTAAIMMFLIGLTAIFS